LSKGRADPRSDKDGLSPESLSKRGGFMHGSDESVDAGGQSEVAEGERLLRE